MSHPELPLECICSDLEESSQLGFAQAAAQLLPPYKDTACEIGSFGLRLLALTEEDLERPVEFLRDVYGKRLDIGPPQVRYVRSPKLQEPHMGVRVLCAPEYFEVVRSDLERRGGTIVDAEVTRQFGIVRATAPLTTLLGYPVRFRELTAGSGRCVMWLSHHAPAQKPRPGGSS
jgi:hypothetical protein